MEYIKLSEFRAHCSQIVKEVSKGKEYLITLKGNPVAEIIPFSPHIERKSWKKKIRRVKVKGEAVSNTLIKERAEQ